MNLKFKINKYLFLKLKLIFIFILKFILNYMFYDLEKDRRLHMRERGERDGRWKVDPMVEGK